MEKKIRAKKFKNSQSNGSISELINLIENSLTDFTSSEEFETKCKGNPSVGEDTITSALRGHLDDKNRNIYSGIFKIETQAEQASSVSGKGKKRTIDIAIATSKSEGHYIFCLEAKKIHARDYVSGDTGAIKRFKKCEHGLSSSNPSNAKPLTENGIVAYIESGNFEDHLNRINDEIQKLSNQFSTVQDEFGLNWQDSEKLTQENLNKYTSNHTRIDKNNSAFKLHHFWVNVAC